MERVQICLLTLHAAICRWWGGVGVARQQPTQCKLILIIIEILMLVLLWQWNQYQIMQQGKVSWASEWPPRTHCPKYNPFYAMWHHQLCAIVCIHTFHQFMWVVWDGGQCRVRLFLGGSPPGLVSALLGRPNSNLPTRVRTSGLPLLRKIGWIVHILLLTWHTDQRKILLQWPIRENIISEKYCEEL